ncbi:hypothetical protein [Actinoplanes sp. ATCC 53533]|uniref:hypothetical protein n=1 Tax=Actinoplanes sp. ATCC 53533 TaxID=1288362 RepID=UPI0013156936|nr:hypothetical protein [Actinoplanes sp. ATCC 53533]
MAAPPAGAATNDVGSMPKLRELDGALHEAGCEQLRRISPGLSPQAGEDDRS